MESDFYSPLVTLSILSKLMKIAKMAKMEVSENEAFAKKFSNYCFGSLN